MSHLLESIEQTFANIHSHVYIVFMYLCETFSIVFVDQIPLQEREKVVSVYHLAYAFDASPIYNALTL